MNVLMVGNGAYPDEIGGAHVYVYDLARHLVRLGHAVTVLVPKARPELPQTEVVQGVTYVRYDHAASRDPVRWRWQFVRGARNAFSRLAADGSFDVIHGHWPHPAAGVIGHPAARSALKVYTLHAPFFEEERVEAAVLRRGNRHRPRDLAKAMWVPVSLCEKRHRERAVLRQCSTVFVLSRFMRQRANACFGTPDSRLNVIPGGVDTERFHPVDESIRQEIRAGLNIAPQTTMLLTVRRLVPRMGLPNLILALDIVRRLEPRVLLCIGGAGPLEPSLEALVEQLSLQRHVRLLGFVPGERLADWYRAADFFVMPSEFLEGFGLATIEAMACGTPALGTPVGGTPEILAGLDSRLLLEGTAPEHIADGIIELLHERSGSLRNDAARYAHEKYSWQFVARRIEAVLLEALAGREAHCGVCQQ